jgi:hypothetical protein
VSDRRVGDLQETAVVTMSMDSPTGPEWPRDARELFVAFWEAATFHAGALQAARDYADKFDEHAAEGGGALGPVTEEFAIEAEMFQNLAEDLIGTFAHLSKQVRITVEKARIDQLENPAEVRRLKDRIRDLHRNLYVECLEALGNGLGEAKRIANHLRSNPEQVDRPEHLNELDQAIDEAEAMLDRDEDPEEQLRGGRSRQTDEDDEEDDEGGVAAVVDS